MTTINNKDLRSTFFTMKQTQFNPHSNHSKEKSEEAENEGSVKVFLSLTQKKILSKQRNFGSKNNLDKN